LHFGSLVAALGSFLEARRWDSEWLVRIEDVDVSRAVPGAADAILRALERCELFWDGPVLYQSQRTEAYRAALERLSSAELAYPCTCSRRELAMNPRGSDGGPIYPGHCRVGVRQPDRPRAIRLRTTDAPLAFRDAVQGEFRQCLASEVGDFVVRRADGLFAYQLAVVVDDADQGVTQVVRGSDLLDSTPRQIYLQRLLGLPTPEYAHLPVAVDGRGNKLSKQQAEQANRRDTARPPRSRPRIMDCLALSGAVSAAGLTVGTSVDDSGLGSHPLAAGTSAGDLVASMGTIAARSVPNESNRNASTVDNAKTMN